MNINFKNVENYYNGDDWRLFNHNDFNTVTILDIKHQSVFDNNQLDQTNTYMQNVEYDQH